jgi:Uma2 family endonuclease
MTMAISNSIPTQTRFTPDDLLRLPDAVNYELVDGQLVERNMGMESSRIGTRIIRILGPFIDERASGELFGADASYQCFPDAPDKVRKPDVSFIRKGRLPGEETPKGHCPISPNLAVEVISPNDLFYDVEEKVSEYLAAGVPLVWIVNPPTRKVHIYRAAGSPLGTSGLLGTADTITGEDVLPGFSCRVGDFFK